MKIIKAICEHRVRITRLLKQERRGSLVMAWLLVDILGLLPLGDEPLAPTVCCNLTDSQLAQACASPSLVIKGLWFYDEENRELRIIVSSIRSENIIIS